MKVGMTLTQMAAEIGRQNAAKRDFVADTRSVSVTDSGEVALALPSGAVQFSAGDIFREQMGSHFKVPREYAERVRGAYPALYANMFNTHLQSEPARRMVRTMDGTARAFLSDRFRPLDNYDLANAVLPELMGRNDITVQSTAITDRRFYIKATSSRIQTEIKRGDVVQIGVSISNSEVGNGSLVVAPLIFRLVCLNGMIVEDYTQRKYHVGKRASTMGEAFEMFSDKTKQLDGAAFFAKVRDTVKGVLTDVTLEKIAQKMRDATEQRIDASHINEIVEVTAKKFGYNEGTQNGILRHLIEGGDLTRYGLMNAVTRQSQDEESYEIATKLEADGSRIIELAKTDWQEIALAA